MEIAKALEKTPTIHTLNLGSIKLGMKEQVQLQIKSIQALDLWNNHIGVQGAIAMQMH